MKNGDWGLGIGDWGLGIGGWGFGVWVPPPPPKPQTPNPQSPIPNPQIYKFKKLDLFIFKNLDFLDIILRKNIILLENLDSNLIFKLN